MSLRPKTAYLVASEDLRMSMNRVGWPEETKMKAAVVQALSAEGWKVMRAHGPAAGSS